jgi:hypothetical protein
VAAEFTVSRRRWCERALLLPALAALGGCVAAPYGTYYRPSTAVPGTRERRAWCQGNAGPVTGLELDLGGGLLLSAWTDRGAPTGLLLRVAISVPSHMRLRFGDAPRLLAAGGQLLDVSWSVSAQRTVAVDPTNWLDPQALRPGTAQAAVEADARFGRLRAQVPPLAGPAPQRIVVQGLRLVRDGRSEAVPAIELARPASRTQAGTYRSPQEQAAARARADACRRDTPQRACDNIVEFAQVSHAAEAAGARWAWRWWTTTAGGAEALQAEVSTAVAEPGRWRLDTAAFQLRDADTGTVRPLRLTSAQLSFDDRIDPRNGVTPGPADTQVLLAAMLPEGMPDFELRLPVLLRDSSPFETAPLRFDRRSFDGGVEPLNC